VNIVLTDEDADWLATCRRELVEIAREGCETYEDGKANGRIEGFSDLAIMLGIMPAITRAAERLRRGAARKE
jgi:hypothetical protein